MNRFESLPSQLQESEVFVARDNIIRIYDGDDKVRSFFWLCNFLGSLNTLFKMFFFILIRVDLMMVI